MTSEKQYLSLEEVAELLGVTYQLIYRLARTGDLPTIRVGKLYRISRKDLEAYLEQSKPTTRTGGTCALCGKSYQSRFSLSKSCIEPECEAPICVDCWDRNKERYCQEHRAAHVRNGTAMGSPKTGRV